MTSEPVNRSPNFGAVHVLSAMQSPMLHEKQLPSDLLVCILKYYNIQLLCVSVENPDYYSTFCEYFVVIRFFAALAEVSLRSP